MLCARRESEALGSGKRSESRYRTDGRERREQRSERRTKSPDKEAKKPEIKKMPFIGKTFTIFSSEERYNI